MMVLSPWQVWLVDVGQPVGRAGRGAVRCRADARPHQRHLVDARRILVTRARSRDRPRGLGCSL